ncbi:MAG: type IV pilus twitching motility protein PilT [Deltaproteobacteria bacterium]|jgi:twitching motility protein PilT|nr:type IV pilus twitching motility protein PilT [Deltaproteobacteria bacterium]
MPLADYSFSDLILAESSPESWFFKGTPDHGQALAPVDMSLMEDLHTLVLVLKTSYESKDPSLSLRVVFQNIAFRAAMYNDICLGRIFFLRRLPEVIPDFDALNLPRQITSWLLQKENSKGLLLFSGAQVSGKTTSAAAFIAARLKTYGGHAITYELPVEMPLSGRHGAHGMCFQTDINSEEELAAHIEHSHRYSSPDIVFVGEIRTRHAASEVLRIALGSSRQLVVATIHGITLSAALDRLLTWAREQDGIIAQHNLAQTLLGIIHQDLTYDTEAGTKTLNVREFLLLPFAEQAQTVRVKIRDGNLFLDENIREQRNRLIHGGKV